MKKILCIIPTLNAAQTIKNQIELLKKQNVDILVIDSSSDDNTLDIVRALDVEVKVIDRKEFDHGGTRTLGAKYKQSDIVVFLTQDAQPFDENCISELIKPFIDDKVAAVYGRQLPYPNETIFGEHLRVFNYGEHSYVRSYEDKQRYGIKTAFLSDSFAAYRTKALKEIDYFKDGLILGEDMYAGAKLLQKGYKLAYAADAKVYHSHSYTITQEFKRYFDIGVFHKNENWILDKFGKPEGEGLKYIRSEFSYLVKQGKAYLLPLAVVRIGAKFLGYKLGFSYKRIPFVLVKCWSMHKSWWNKGK